MTEKKVNKKIPKMTIIRLARYLNCLSLLPRELYKEISSKELASKIGLKPTQVRQDFHHFGGFGQAGYRYKVDDLIKGMEEILGLDRSQNLIIVGVGHLGQALANYRKFEDLGLRLVGLFDTNPRLVGMAIRDVKVRDIDEIPDIVKSENVSIGVIATPTESAQITADLLVSSGIRGLWNFSPINILTPPDVIIQNEHLSVGLMTLSYKLKQIMSS
ncbi:redox-sensing transcriptional repressor Rex [candidate division LCP-89 bacterium B3_LCP]|uniref:Redox-sensing transcriptional repressor Rex n=1 Tax=candidate division LCP-89 bacterium B3_LCP TaxID=2012998 RepID=A0A532UZE3_UNCL8|nr:MAG: redox-sensing transcriptional repressor Rex [candidate division LCP-89 bacterium B3_LCP]